MIKKIIDFYLKNKNLNATCREFKLTLGKLRKMLIAKNVKIDSRNRKPSFDANLAIQLIKNGKSISFVAKELNLKYNSLYIFLKRKGFICKK
jgi:hypothetical protein